MTNKFIIRKIDELGRVVIPKDIRKTVKIKENDDLEINCNGDEIIIRKYHTLRNLLLKLINYVNTLCKYFYYDVIICDTEQIIYVNNNNYKELEGSNITNSIENIQKERKIKIVNDIDKLNLSSTVSINTKYALIPILLNSNMIGIIILIKNDSITENDVNMFKLLIDILESEEL